MGMDYQAAIIDVDGTIVRGDTPIDGADRGLSAIDAAGLDRLFVSNNPTKRPPAYERRLTSAGFDVDAAEVITAGTATTSYLDEEYHGDTVYLVGEAELAEQFTDAGITVAERPTDADVFIASIDFEFSYDDMQQGLRVLADPEVPFIGTDPDIVIPTDTGNIPGSGAIIGAIETVTERSVDVICGKPSTHVASMALDRLGDPAPERCLVIGDRLDTDILLGDRAGMTTVLVQTGITDDRRLADSPIEPDYVLDSISEIDCVLG